MSGASGRVLVVGAHPDDPDFLAGGTVARLAKEGREVRLRDSDRWQQGIG